MIAKKLLKKLVFGNLVTLPHEIEENMSEYKKPIKLNSKLPDKEFKVILCEARLTSLN